MADLFNPELEERILGDPNDPAPYLIYADWLQGQGDPLGELIAVQHALRHQREAKHELFDRIVDPPSGKRAPPLVNARELAEAERRLFSRYGRAWLGPLLNAVSDVRLRWRMGFVAEASFRLDYGVFDNHQNLIIDFLQRPVARLLRSLRVDLASSPFQIEFCEFRWLDHQRSIEKLNLISRGPFALPARPVMKVARLAHTFPRLRSLRLILRHQLDLSELDFPRLKTLELINVGSANTWRGIGEAELPELSSLTLEGGVTGQMTIAEHLEPMFRMDGKTQLKRLRLALFLDGNALIELLSEWPVLKRLELLDLSGCTIYDNGAEHILAHADRFRHLRQLVIPPDYISDALYQRLQTFGPQLGTRFWPSQRRHQVTAA